ncbi:MAG: hypothetical protein M3Y13_07950 [Armatimonadota bacterium]|nr:hypothetical protein [Armatimonadota bacterium]
MKPLLLTLSLVVMLCVLMPQAASALSRPLPSPQLNFAQGYSPKWAPQVLHILNEPQAHYLGGLISEWPPNWWTVLDYNGDTAAFNSMLASLESVKGLHIAVSFTRGSASSTPPGSWTVEYSQVTPDKIALIINLKSDNIDLAKLQLPEYRTDEDSPQTSKPARLPREILRSRFGAQRLTTEKRKITLRSRA